MILLLFYACSFAEPSADNTSKKLIADPFLQKIEEHVQKMNPGTEYSVERVKWDFPNLDCGVSREHSRRSQNQYWMVRDGGVETSLELEKTFAQQGFFDSSERFPPVQWAQLALCVQNMQGYTLVQQVDVDSFAEWLNITHVQAPALQRTDAKTTLTYWVYASYRGVPTFYQHTLSTEEKRLINTRNDGISFSRINP